MEGEAEPSTMLDVRLPLLFLYGIVLVIMAQTLQQFFNNRVLETCTHPKGVKGQCVCLIRCYFDDVLELKQFPSVKSAKDLWNVLSQQDFIRVPNTLFAIPRAGDIFVIDAFNGNPHGHTGIVMEGSNFAFFRSFDSNWSRPLIATSETHNYWTPRVIGYFRKRTNTPTIERVNEALRACNDDPNRPVGTLTLSKWWQNRVKSDPKKFTNDEAGYQALVGAIQWHQANHKYPHDN